jgi:glycine/D-amino acid oxidase-like deaminating enzyme
MHILSSFTCKAYTPTLRIVKQFDYDRSTAIPEKRSALRRRLQLVRISNMTRNGDISFWHSDMGGLPPYRPALPGDRVVDVCIIGAGYTGLWTAWYLKQAAPDLSIAIVEREFAGFGASGRNGGWLSGAFDWNRDRYAKSGSRAGVIALERAMRGTVDEIIRVSQAEGIDADIRRTDELVAACTSAQMGRLCEQHATAMAWDVPKERMQLIGASEMTDRIRVKNAVGALVLRGVARIQPAKLVRGLAQAVERVGVSIYEQTTVTGMSKGQVTTDHGTVRAAKIIRATEGYTASLPGQSRDMLAMNSSIVVTEPLPDALWDQIGWQGGELLGDAVHGYCYAQRTAGNRIAMGGRGVPYRFGNRLDDRGQTQQKTIAMLQAIIHRLVPQVSDVKLDHAWCGVLGVPRDWCARVDYDPASGIGAAGGYVGLGVSTSNLAGQTLADLVLERDTELTKLPWVNRSSRKWEPEPLRWLGVHGMYQLYHMADRREARCNTAQTSRLARIANYVSGR